MLTEKLTGPQTHAIPRPDETDQNLPEAERLKATDLVQAMSRRVECMRILLENAGAPAGERRLSFEDRLGEHEDLTEKLRIVTLRWRLGQTEDES